ncbi:SCO family protein [Photobacterium sp. MCCC 1A19761]|uniref:SCO family protein n=1 Tax=Photobacterium sp. MCCC 1A19761 TaxID=3115000 RepID=UPI00307EB9B4
MRKSMLTALLLCLGMAMGLTLNIAVSVVPPEPSKQQTIEWLDNPRPVANFSLASEAGTFTRQSLTGHWTIVLFGFLHCPDICPTSLAQLARLVASLADTPTNPDIAFVFVSVDPGRDSVTDLSQYVRYFDPSILGVTGSEAQLTAFADSLGIRFEVSPDDEDYSVAHSIKFSIIDPEGVFRGRFPPGFDATALARELAFRVEADR